MFLSLTHDLKPGEAKPLPQYQNEKFLLNNNGQYKIGSNICPHQASKIISQKSNNILCQYHGWSWDSNGNPTGNGYTKVCNNNKISLADTHEHQGLIFSNRRELPELPIQFDMFELKEHRVDRIKVDNPMHVMNVFLDVDHIPLVHKNVYDSMGIVGEPDVEWEYFQNGSVQKVYHSGDANRPLIFMWLAIYPYTMIEWQHGSLFITDCFSTKDGYTDVAVYKYRDCFASNYEYETNQSTWEIAWSQDKFQSEQMVAVKSQMFEEQKHHYLNWINLNGTSPK